jgi:hypothetical protein
MLASCCIDDTSNRKVPSCTRTQAKRSENISAGLQLLWSPVAQVLERQHKEAVLCTELRKWCWLAATLRAVSGKKKEREGKGRREGVAWAKKLGHMN